MKKWWAAHPDLRKKYNKTYQQKHKEEIKQRRKEWAKRHPDAKRNWHYRVLYGISAQEKRSLLAFQNSKCAICSIDINISTGHIDHSHSRGCVRGLVCTKCNTCLGNGSVDFFRKVIRYLTNNPYEDFCNATRRSNGNGTDPTSNEALDQSECGDCGR
jgi:hypothetical protein